MRHIIDNIMEQVMIWLFNLVVIVAIVSDCIMIYNVFTLTETYTQADDLKVIALVILILAWNILAIFVNGYHAKRRYIRKLQNKD